MKICKFCDAGDPTSVEPYHEPGVCPVRPAADNDDDNFDKAHEQTHRAGQPCDACPPHGADCRHDKDEEALDEISACEDCALNPCEECGELIRRCYIDDHNFNTPHIEIL